MSRHGYDDVAQVAGEKTTQDRHSHHNHFNLKPSSVIDHLKTKVKRKSKNDSFEISESALNNHTNGNTNDNNNQSNQDHHREFISSKPITTTQSHPFISSLTLPNQSSNRDIDIECIDDNNVFVEKDEQDSVVPNEVNEDEDENIQWRTNHVVPDINPKITKPKQKTIKATKSLPDTTNQSNVRKRRQTIRRMGFQIRDEDFSGIFSDLPSDEQLVIAYPCAWRKDVFMHGRMFLSVNYLSFYTCFFKWEESVSIAYKDIISVTREKSAKLVPNAIKLRTINQEQYLFASYVPRERIFIAIFRLWQNALLEQPLDYQQLRAVIYNDQENHDESTADSEESIVLENSGEHSPESRTYSHSFPTTSNYSTELSTQRISAERPRRVVSWPPDNEPITYLSSCTCASHPAKTYTDRLFTFNVDTLFELICGDNSFTRAFHNSQNLTDYTIGEWRLNDETGKRERQVNYKTISQSILGTNTLICQEKQTKEVEKPHLMYVVNTEVYNEGVRYTDAFYVATRFCMVQHDAEHSSLRITAEIRYVKSVNGIIKSFIEKNANSSLENGIAEQVRRLDSQQVVQGNRMSNRKTTPASKQRVGKSTENNTIKRQIDEDSSVNSVTSVKSKLPMKEKSFTGKGVLYDIGILVGIFFLLVHIYLCYKLYSIDQLLLTPDAISMNQCQKSCLDNNAHR